MPAAIWRNVDRIRATGFVAVAAFGLLASTAFADDGTTPPEFFMTWDASGDSVGANTYNWNQFGSIEYGTWELAGGTGMDPGAQSHWRTGWRYTGDLVGEGWLLDWDCVINADPFVDATINVTNTSDTVQEFSVLMPLTIAPPIVSFTTMAGSVSAAVTDQSFDGSATLAASPIKPVYQGYIDGVPQLNARMWDPGYTLTASSLGASNSDGDFFNNQIGPAALTQIAIELRFTLTPGDSASVTGTFDVVAIPAPAALPLLAGFGLLAGGRRRRS